MLVGWALPTVTLAAPASPTVMLVFAPVGEGELASVPGASVGIMSASQGRYSQAQLALDIGQGARVSASAYKRQAPSPLALRQAGQGGVIEGWSAARRRAAGAPQLLSPGLLAGSIPGGAGYVGLAGMSAPDAPVAAGPAGRVAGVSLGPGATVAERAQAMLPSRRLVVVDLPASAGGRAQLASLAAERAPNELLLVVQRSADPRVGALLWGAAVGLASRGGELSSPSTQQRGLIVSIDIAPSILAHLGTSSLPPAMRGRPIATDGSLSSAGLRSLMARLRVLGGRRLRALAWLLLAWIAILLAASPWPPTRARALRIGAVGMLWAPVAVLIPAALAPGAAVEYTTIVIACMGLGAVTDLLIPWPRALLAPAIAALVAITVDALAHTQLLMRSLLGPDPILGARFYGIGNELKSGLAVLVLAAVAGALYPAVRGRGATMAMAAAGIVLAVIEGSARIGAGVGGVILVCGAFAVAVAMLAAGDLTRRRTLVVLISPVVGLVVLALIDLLTAGGSGHYTGSVLHAGSPAELRDIIVRRYGAAWRELINSAMPVASAVALAAAMLGVRERKRLLGVVGGDPAWLAALSGGLAAGVLGSLVEDSGPVLLVVAVFALGCVLTYLWAGKPLSRRTSDRRPGSLSRARRRPAAPAR
ncbi:MAG TPA: hypothetical protein VGN25_00230 [Solirubrobacteraceae bacterium]|nr:hypothetical protein [Solirubrobacteraceae bacterium]